MILLPRKPTRRPSLLVLAALVATALLLSLPACGTTADALSDPVAPPKPVLTSPESAVHSYLDWVSLAYRMADSEVASETHTPMQGVRVDSYIELNRQQGRGIEQRLEEFHVRGGSREGTAALLAATERWRYRYFSLDGLRYTSPEHTASYDTTYTLLLQDGRWLVDGVEVAPLTEVK